MKRSVLSVATALLAVAGMAFSGCQKDVNSNVKDTEKAHNQGERSPKRHKARDWRNGAL